MPPALVTPPVPTSRLMPRESWVVVIVLLVGALLGWNWWQSAQADRADAGFPRNPALRQARTLVFGLDATVADYAQAEAIVARALATHPDDPDTIITAADVHNWHYIRGFDRSEDRFQTMQRYSLRAMQLAPQHPDAMASMGEFLQVRGTDLSRAIDLLQRAIAVNPRVPRWHSSLAEALRLTDPAAGLAVLERAVAQFPQDVLIRYNLARHYRDVGRLEDLERVLDEVIALQPLANALLWKARVLLWAHGDVAGMKATLDRVPAPLLVSERAAINHYTHAMISREPTTALRILRDLPNDWFDDYDYVGPKALLVGGLLELQGRNDEARAQYQAGYALLQQRKPRHTASDSALRVGEIWSLLALGRIAEARAAFRVYLNTVPRPYLLGFSSSWWFSEIPAALLLDDREAALQLLREAVTTPAGRAQVRIALQIDPRIALWRQDPEITALLSEPAAAP